MILPYFLTEALSVAAAYKYPLIFVGAFAEGPILMIASGFLLHRDILNLLPLFLALVFGDLVGDILWYSLGYYFLEPILVKRGTFLGVTPELFQKIKNLYDTHHENILIVSKLTLGFGVAIGVLMIAGATRVPFKKYLLINFIGELFLVALLISTGYFFGDIYTTIEASFRMYFLFGLFFAILLAIFVLSRIFKKILLKK